MATQETSRKMKMYVFKTLTFSAAHRIYNPNFSEEKNHEIFGKDDNFYGHGHNYKLIVGVVGTINPDTGYVYDANKLGDVVQECLIKKLDHKNLNFDVDFMRGVMPTSENFLARIWPIIQEALPEVQLSSLRVYENETLWVEYRGEHE